MGLPESLSKNGLYTQGRSWDSNWALENSRLVSFGLATGAFLGMWGGAACLEERVERLSCISISSCWVAIVWPFAMLFESCAWLVCNARLFRHDLIFCHFPSLRRQRLGVWSPRSGPEIFLTKVTVTLVQQIFGITWRFLQKPSAVLPAVPLGNTQMAPGGAERETPRAPTQ
jgi:hypothetical protein